MKTIQIKYIDRIVISRLEQGVPKIDANNREDYFFALGYIQALDRGMQMLFTRILGQGRACELLKNTPDLLQIDIFFRRMHWRGDLEKQKSKIKEKSFIKAYTDGVNAGFLRKYPWELKLLKIKYEPWQIEDSLLIAKMIGYIGLASAQGLFENFVFDTIKNGLALKKATELFRVKIDALTVDLIARTQKKTSFIPEAVLNSDKLPKLTASNNWVVSGNLTQSGFPMLANDPHLEINRLPGVWQEIHGAVLDSPLAGFSIPGLPGIIIGRNANLSWGATYTFMDAIDSWVENVSGSKYQDGKTYKPLQIREEIIRRKGKSPHIQKFYETHRGVLDYDESCGDGLFLSTRWAGDKNIGAQSVNSILGLMFSDDVKSGMEQVGKIELSFSWVLCDRKNNIGFQMSGLMPKRSRGHHGLLPAEGFRGKNDWQGFVEPRHLPREYNPKRGYIITANNDLNHLGKMKPINACMAKYRSNRIEEMLKILIATKKKIAVEDFMQIQNDVKSNQAEWFLSHLNKILMEKKILNKFQGWDYQYSTTSSEAVLFEKWYHHLTLSIFGESLGRPSFLYLMKRTPVLIDFFGNFDQILMNPKSVWLNKKSAADYFCSSYLAVQKTAVQTWGEVNKTQMKHILLGDSIFRFLGLNSKRISIKGNRATVSQGQIFFDGKRSTSFVPSVRFITDMGSNHIYTVIAGGASERPFSRFYKSEISDWLHGRYKKI